MPNDLLKTADCKPVIFEKEFEYQYQARIFRIPWNAMKMVFMW